MTRVHALALRIGGWTLLAALASGCAIDRVAFRPREHVDGESPGGHAAASYDLRATPEGPSSEVRIWSGGVLRLETGEVVVHVGFEFENRFDAPLRLDLERTAVVEIEAGDAPIQPLASPIVDGAPSVAPRRVGLLGLRYVLPAEVSPDDVRSFAVRWTVAEPMEFEQHTAFRRAPRRTSPDYGYWSYGFPLFHYRRGFGYHGYSTWCF